MYIIFLGGIVMSNQKKPSILTTEIFNVLNISHPELEQIELIEKLVNEHKIESLIDNDQQLSRREQSCLFYTALGRTAKEIAGILGIEKCTVDEYKKNIIKKLNCNNMNHCIYRAIKRKILGINHFGKRSISSDLSRILHPGKMDDDATDNDYRVLLVEDNEIAQKIGKMLLSSHRCDIHLAESVQEAILRSNERAYDFILMDIGLPDGTGLEATRYVRDHSRHNKKTPIIAVTAHFSEEENRTECLESGINQIYSKPLTTECIEAIFNDFIFKNGFLPLAARNKINHQEVDVIQKTYPSVDLEETAKRLNISINQIERIFSEFISELPMIKEKIEDYLFHKRWGLLQKEVHKLHGGSSYAGAIYLEKVCSNLGSFLIKQTETAQELCGEVIAELELLIEDYYSPNEG